MIEITAEQIAALTKGKLEGAADRVVRAAAPLEKASPDALSFIASTRYLAYLPDTRAGVLLIKPEWAEMAPRTSSRVVVDDPHDAFRRVLTRLYPRRAPSAGIHATAVIGVDAQIAPEAEVGAYAVLGDGVAIGPGTVIGPHAIIGNRCRIGSDVTIHPHVTLYEGVRVEDRVTIHSGARIGKEGFGFLWRDGGHQRIPQIGGCVIESDVEIGTNVTIDRGAVADTVIGAGTKIDNLVHVGHNVRIGKHVILVAQVGISGSTTIGDGALLAGQAGVAGHIDIGPGARVGGQAGVFKDVPAGETYSGYPARPHRDAMRAIAAMFKLPDFFRRVERLEERIEGGEGK